MSGRALRPRDSAESTTVDPEAPGYTLRDLAADGAALTCGLNDRPAHLAGIGVGGMVAAGAKILDDDPAAARATAERVFDRTPGTGPAVQLANQLGMVFSKLDCTPRWRGRLPELAMPVLVVHGRRDRFFPVGNGEALARGCSCSNRLRPRSPTRPPMTSPRRRSNCRRSLTTQVWAPARLAD